MPTEPFDFYVDFASLNVSNSGLTLILLRSLPEPRGGRGLDITQADLVAEAKEAPERHINIEEDVRMTMEIVARVRFGPAFAVALRDLLTRSLINAGLETEGHVAAPADGSSVDASSPTSSANKTR